MARHVQVRGSSLFARSTDDQARRASGGRWAGVSMSAEASAQATLMPERAPRWWTLLGPAAMVSVGYMDPGNWATDLEGGARYGYGLVWVLVASNLIALVLQTLTSRLGLVTGLDLATACRAHYTRPVSLALWALAELAIVACDLAEVLGSAVALKLLFGLPMVAGVLVTVLDVFVLLALQRRGVRALYAFVAVLVVTIAACMFAELALVRPSLGAVAAGLVPRLHGGALPLVIGIVGATVMPHNLYLQSALVRRHGPVAPARLKQWLRSSFLGTGLALNVALLVNGAILVLAGAVFATRGLVVDDLREAHRLLAPLVGTGAAATLFAVALLCAGQSATITGTLAGQIVMEGFLDLRVSPFVRRVVTRGLAVVPAALVLAWVGEGGTMPLLIGSQVVLSLQLPFAIVPLLRFTGSEELMGRFASRPAVRLLAAACVVLVTVANAALVVHTVGELRAGSPLAAHALAAVGVAGLGLLAWVALVPLRRARAAETPVEADALGLHLGAS